MAEPNEVAASFGYSLSFFRHDPELSSLLDRATASQYTPERFVAELQNTNWYRGTSEARRKYNALATTDPSTLADQVNEMLQKMTALGAEVGGDWGDPGNANHMARTFIATGASDVTIRAALASRLSMDKGRYTGGQAAQAAMFIHQTLGDYGVSADGNTISWHVGNIVRGNDDGSAFKSWAQDQAASKWPGLASRIANGETVRQIASPYFQEYGKVLEVDSENLTLDEPLIQRALTRTDKNGKPATQTIWEFQNDLRNDSRWLKTQNAQDTTMKAARGVLTDLGLMA